MLFHRWVLIAVAVWFSSAVVAAAPRHAGKMQQQESPSSKAQSSNDPNEKFCTLSGTVTSANTGEPLRRAHISLEDQKDEDARPIEVLSDSTGHFEITKIPAGRYELTVSRDGYRAAHYQDAASGGEGALLTLAPGHKITGMTFRLWKLAVISGRVVDSNGDPVPHVAVTAVEQKAGRKKTFNTSGRSAATDDRGEYRIFDLPSGRYLIAALSPESRGFSSIHDAQVAEFRTTYYPQTSDPARASLIQVKSGDEITGMDMALVSAAEVRTFVVRGRVVDTTGMKDARFMVTLLPRGNSVLGYRDRRFAEVDEDTGGFEFRDVAAGDYTLMAQMDSGPGEVHALQDVSVVTSDPDDVTLVMSKGVSIAARINLEGKEAASAKSFRIELEPADAQSGEDPYRGFYAVPQPDGSYKATSVNDGTYRLSVASDCGVCYLKAADANGVDVLARGLQVSGSVGPAPIDILYSSESGRVSGVVRNNDDSPAIGATVVVISAAPHGGRQTARTDQYGHYEVLGLPPGDYNVYAFAHFDRDTLDDPEALQPYADRREAVSVTANATRTFDLKVISVPEAQN
jgi:hypothetical protein